MTADFKYAPFARVAALSATRGSSRGAQIGQGRVERSGDTLDLERLQADALAKTLAPAVLLHRYPKSGIEVCVLVLQSDGGEWPACVVASSLALADAGVEQYGLVSCVTVGRRAPSSSPSQPAAAAGAGAGSAAASDAAKAEPAVPAASEPVVLVDLTGEEEAAAASTTTLAYCRAADRITCTRHAGAMTAAAAVGDMSLALEACGVVEAEMRRVLVAAEARKGRRLVDAAASSAAGAGFGGAAASSAAAAPAVAVGGR